MSSETSLELKSIMCEHLIGCSRNDMDFKRSKGRRDVRAAFLAGESETLHEFRCVKQLRPDRRAATTNVPEWIYAPCKERCFCPEDGENPDSSELTLPLIGIRSIPVPHRSRHRAIRLFQDLKQL